MNFVKEFHYRKGWVHESKGRKRVVKVEIEIEMNYCFFWREGGGRGGGISTTG